MVRQCLLVVLCLGAVAACSDPADVPADAAYTQAQCDYKEPNESIETAMLVGGDDMGTAALCTEDGAPADHDFYRFTATGNPATITVQYNLRIRGSLGIRLYNTPVSSVWSGDSELWTGSDEPSTLSVTCPNTSPICDALVAGNDYILEVYLSAGRVYNLYPFGIAYTFSIAN